MYKFVGYRHLKGTSKAGNPYDFRTGYFLCPIDSAQVDGAGYSVFMRQNNYPTVSDSFIEKYDIGTTFTDLTCNVKGEIIDGVVANEKTD